MAQTFIAISPLTKIGVDHTPQSAEYGSVVVPLRPQVVVAPYLTGAEVTLTRPSSTAVPIVLEKAWTFSFIFDSALLAQTGAYNLPEASRVEAIRMVAKEQEATFVPAISAAVPAINKGANAGVVTGNVNLGTTGSPLPANQIAAAIAAGHNVLDQQGVPPGSGRWILTSFRVMQLLREIVSKDLISEAASYPGAQAMVFGGVPVYLTASLANGRVLIGHESAIGWAQQTRVRPPSEAVLTHAMTVKGMIIFGLSVLNPKGIAEVIIA
jgi:hypothetical protein